MTERTGDEFGVGEPPPFHAGSDHSLVAPVSDESAVEDEPDYSSMTLDGLADAARAERRNIDLSVNVALSCHLRLGRICAEARRRCALRGEWTSWIASAGLAGGPSSIRRLVRLGLHADRLPAEAWEPFRDDLGRLRNPSFARIAEKYLPGLPEGAPRPAAYPDELKRRVKEMRAEGVSVREIAEATGCSTEAVKCWTTPGHAEAGLRRQREARRIRARERAALHEKEKREEALRLAKKNAGSALSDAYGDIRKTLAHVAKALADSTGAQAALVDAALSACQRAEEAITAALSHVRAN